MKDLRSKRPGKKMFLSFCLLLSSLSLAFFGGCQGGTTNPLVADETVQVGAEGGFGTITFEAVANNEYKITLTGTPATMEPYGSLAAPNGAAADVPGNGGSTNGVNSEKVILTQTGQYTLTVFDGSNQGGSAAVKIELVTR